MTVSDVKQAPPVPMNRAGVAVARLFVRRPALFVLIAVYAVAACCATSAAAAMIGFSLLAASVLRLVWVVRSELRPGG
jgi:hypothetical protein